MASALIWVGFVCDTLACVLVVVLRVRMRAVM
jgi:hypothetical protein